MSREPRTLARSAYLLPSPFVSCAQLLAIANDAWAHCIASKKEKEQKSRLACLLTPMRFYWAWLLQFSSMKNL